MMPQKQRQGQFTFGPTGQAARCGRCGAPCKVNPIPGSKAKWLKAASVPKGLCLNCAVHDTLRHVYPVNLILQRSAGRSLLCPQAQREFFELAEMHGTDARLEDIDWQAIVANWDMPFPSKVKRMPTNPVTDEELAMARLEGEQRRAGTWKEPLTEEEYESQRRAAIVNFLDVMHGNRHGEDTPTDHCDGG